jgi:hypothetical protein
MLQICCWCDKRLGTKVPLELEGITGSACEECCRKLLEDIRRECGWAYYLVLSRDCSHLFNNITGLLRGRPHLKVLLDRRRRNGGTGALSPPRPESPGLRSVLPRRLHLVVRRDCLDLVEDLAPAFAHWQEILVLVDRRARPRTPLDPPQPDIPEQRVIDPPAFLV